MVQLGEQKISYLIIGNGIAGVTAAEVLRAEDPQASIGVIADDPCPVYYRPALKDYLGGYVPTEKLWARSTSFYRDVNVAFLPDHVIGLDSESHTILLQSHKQVQYYKLLLANGASPARLNCPGTDLEGVTTLRTVTDYQKVMERLGTVRRVVVSGSGTLALETAGSLRQRGVEVTHLLRGTTLWSEVLDATASDLVLQEERRAGVEVCLEEEIVKITGRRGMVSGVVTNRGRHLACQMVLVAIGIEPNIRPWKVGGVSCGRGVRVDDALRTNLPDIYAAGDVIEIRDRLTNRTRVLGQWYPAIQQARIAAYSMLGRAEEVEAFGTKTFYNATFLYGLDFASAGLTITPKQAGYEELVADPQPRSYRKVILKDGIPVGLLALGDRKQAPALKRAIDERVNLRSVAERLFQADFNLHAWLDERDEGSSSALSVETSLPTELVISVGSVELAGQVGLTEQAGLTGSAQGTIPTGDGGQGQEEAIMIGRGQAVGTAHTQARGEEIMIDREQRQGMGIGPIPTNPTDCEALLVHIVDPALRFHIPEISLNRMAGRVQGQPIRIGRQAGVHVLLDEGSVSRQHAEISYAAGHYLLRDLGSTNGTFINEQRLDASRPYVLEANDILRFGNIVRLKFLLRVIAYQSRIEPIADQENRRDSAEDPWLKAQGPHKTRPLQGQSDQYAIVMPDTVGEVDTYLEELTIGQAILNRDGTLSTPGSNKPVPAPLVEQLKKAPALVIIPGGSVQNGIAPEIHFLNPGKRTTIGRANDNDIVLADKTVSGHHAEVFLDITGFYIDDLSSSHGTAVNQRRIDAPYLLTHSDRIKLGTTRIFFVDLQAGKEATTKTAGVRVTTGGSVSAAIPAIQPSGQNERRKTQPVGGQTGPRQGTRVTQSYTAQQTNVAICPRCGVANAPVARFCASCSAVLGQGQPVGQERSLYQPKIKEY